MKRVFLAGASVWVMAWAAPAVAADIPASPAYPAKVVAPVYTWSGVYIGAHVGYGWSQWTNDTTFGGAVIASDSAKVGGGLGGLQLGFNWQSGAMVYGLETDITASSQRNTSVVSGVTTTGRIRWFGTTRARIGFAADRWMFYGTGGVAYTGLEGEVSFGGVSDAVRTTRVGWTVGLGVENAISPNWTWRTEYLYIDAAKITSTTGALTDTFRVRNNVFRLGLNYKM